MGDKKIALVEKMVQFAEQEAASGDYLNAIIILDKNAKELKEFISTFKFIVISYSGIEIIFLAWLLINIITLNNN